MKNADKSQMEKHFKDKVFFEELEMWDHLLTLRDQTFDLGDGFYFVEYIEQKNPFELRYDRFIKFEKEQEMEDVLYELPYPGPRMIFHVKEKRILSFKLDSCFLKAKQAVTSGKWEELSYYDVVLDYKCEKVVFPTAEEAAAAVEKLTQLLIMQTKKVS